MKDCFSSKYQVQFIHTSLLDYITNMLILINWTFIYLTHPPKRDILISKDNNTSTYCRCMLKRPENSRIQNLQWKNYVIPLHKHIKITLSRKGSNSQEQERRILKIRAKLCLLTWINSFSESIFHLVLWKITITISSQDMSTKGKETSRSQFVNV